MDKPAEFWSELSGELFALCKKYKLHALVTVPLTGREAQVIMPIHSHVTPDWALRNALGALEEHRANLARTNQGGADA